MAVAIPLERRRVTETIEHVPLELIDQADDNPRADVGDVAELAASIASVGILEPLVVTPRGDRYLLVCGARRHAAAKVAGETTAPAIVRDLDETERVLAMAIENLQRVDLSPIEEARAYRQLRELGITQRDLANRVGRSQAHISKRLSLLDLPDVVVGQLDSGGITVQVGLELAKLAAHPERIQAVIDDSTVDGQVVDVQELGWEIEQQLAEVAREDKVAAARAQLEAAGVRVLDAPANGYASTPKGSIKITKSGGYEALKIHPAKHAGEPCHAAMLSHYGDVVYLCTDRKRHPKLKTESESYRGRSGGAMAKQRAEARDITAAATARREFAATVLAKRIPQAEILDQLVVAFVAASHSEALKLACRMLDIEPDRKVAGSGYASRDFGAVLRGHAATSDKNRAAVLLALTAGTHEEFMTGPWNGWSDRDGYISFLEKHGYTLAPIEAKKLGRKNARGRGRAKTEA